MEIILKDGGRVNAMVADSADEFAGVNSQNAAGRGRKIYEKKNKPYAYGKRSYNDRPRKNIY